jgi:hypothetical protein
MAESSIFDGVVKTENQYTRLLYNLLLRDSVFRASFLLFLTERSETSTVGIDEIKEQTRLRPNRGVADLLIQTKDLAVIVEIKTEAARGLTGKQLLIDGPDDDPESYVSYLASKAKEGFDAQLIFLIPPDWKLRSDVESVIKEFKDEGRTRGVVVKQLTWLGLSRFLTDGPSVVEMSLLREFRNLLSTRFTPVHLLHMELEMLADGHFTLITAVKLYKIVTDVRSLAKKAGLPVTPIESAESYFGFTLKREQSGLLWFGCLPTFPWETETPALCIQGDLVVTESCKKAFREILGHYLTSEGEWITAAVPNGDLTLGAEHIFTKLQKIWQRITETDAN